MVAILSRGRWVKYKMQQIKKNVSYLVLQLSLPNPLKPGVKSRMKMYREVSNISSTLVGNKIVDHSDEVGASPVGAAPTTSSFST